MEDALRASAGLRFPLIVKPRHGYSSAGLSRKSRVVSREALRARTEQIIARFGGVLIEEFVEGREFTTLVAENPDLPRDPPPRSARLRGLHSVLRPHPTTASSAFSSVSLSSAGIGRWGNGPGRAFGPSRLRDPGPRAATLTSDIAFMIAEACVAESAYRQQAYLLEQFMICEGRSAEEASKAAALERVRYETEDYAEYVKAAEYLNNHEIYKLMELDSPLYTGERFRTRNRSADRPGSYYDPAPMLDRLGFPILALFGAKDKNIDPIQGVEAYRRAFQAAGNKLTRVELIPNANHVLYEAETGCVRELMAQVAEGKPRYGPGVLRIIAEWLEVLKAEFEP